MRFGSNGRTSDPSSALLSAAEAARPSLDLRRVQPWVAAPASLWVHEIRCLVGGYRVVVPELAVLAGAGTSFVGALRGDAWELRLGRSIDVVSAPVAVDDRWRVVVPLGVRHCLGLLGTVVVSLAVDLNRVLVWPSRRLDDLLEVGP